MKTEDIKEKIENLGKKFEDKFDLIKEKYFQKQIDDFNHIRDSIKFDGLVKSPIHHRGH